MRDSLRALLEDGAGRLGVTLQPGDVDRFLLLGVELRRWNRKINLTAITDDRQIIIKHILDSLTVTALFPAGYRVLDLGSGGGFPALPLALVRPDLKITSVDATLKKIHFQRHAARLLGITNLETLHARGESLAVSHAGKFDAVVSRAFSSLQQFVTLAHPVVSPSGSIIAMKGKGGSEEAADATPFLHKLGLAIQEVMHLHLPVSGDERSLIVIRAL